MKSTQNVLFVAAATLVFGLIGCGGSSDPTPPPPPAAAVSVALSAQPPASLTVNAQTALTANVSNDSANAGVRWTVTCGSSACGSFSAASTASGASTTYTAPAAVPTSNTVTVTATSVTDSTKTASATITITPPAPPPVMVLITPLPPSSLTVNAKTSIMAIVSNDSANGGVKWTASCGTSACGSFGSAQTASGSSVVYTAPSAVPTGNTVTVTATSITDTTKSASATIIIAATSSAILNDGTYVYHVAGQNANGPCFFAGAFVIANGVITGGEQDFSDSVTGYSNAINQAGSSISSGSGTNLQIVLATSNTNIGPNGNGAITLQGTKVSNSRTLVSEYDGYATGTGSIDLQTSVAAPAGGYAFLISGVGFDTTKNPVATIATAIGGVLNISGTTLSASNSVFDFNFGGTLKAAQSFASGSTNTPDSYGRMTFTLTPSTASGVAAILLTGYVVGTNQIQLIESQADGLNYNLAGMALGQGSNAGTFTSNSITGTTYVYGSSGVDSNGVLDLAGSFAFSNGTVSGPMSINDLVKQGEDTITGGSYTVDATGRVTLSNVTTQYAPLGGPYAFEIYLDGNGNALVMGADLVEISAGPGYRQTVSSPVLAGTYALTNQGFLVTDTDNPPWSAGGAVTVTSGSYSGFTDYNDSGTPTPNVSLTGSLDNSSGILSLAGFDAVAFTTANDFVSYPIDNNRAVFISIDQYLLGLGAMEGVNR
ncbi:beta strand repeat-containing protein [Edaphobacter modestus]|uniref:Ig-like domain-containing protein n=1 Tax=Edaphobacter modestus TaxID=388466 RepID=A0A4V2G4B4_9BACT|nr:hypothetical protein [Edaphobacter modestus]RZU40286.1 hypothetical protein BDD14_1732 [Edaphobacter modestus]